ncbi:hypothetical protein V8E54_012678 [Elaphomyces granulatus]
MSGYSFPSVVALCYWLSFSFWVVPVEFLNVVAYPLVKATDSTAVEEEEIKSPFVSFDIKHPVVWLVPVSIAIIGLLTAFIYAVRCLARHKYPISDGTAASMTAAARIVAEGCLRGYAATVIGNPRLITPLAPVTTTVDTSYGHQSYDDSDLLSTKRARIKLLGMLVTNYGTDRRRAATSDDSTGEKGKGVVSY